VTDVIETRYARTTDGLHIAYQVSGQGPVLVELSDGTLFSFDSSNEQPSWQDYVERLASFSTLVRFDLRGIGLSDPLRSTEPPTLEQWMADTLAVMDAAEVSQGVLLGVGYGGLPALMTAATHPERTQGMILANAYACMLRKPDYPAGVPAAAYERFAEDLVDPDRPSGDDLPLMAPSLAANPAFAAWWRKAGHRGASPATARAIWNTSAADLRPLLDVIRVPTLVVHSRDCAWVRVAQGRYLAEHIPQARYIELPTADQIPWAMTSDVTGEIEEFVTGSRRLPTPQRLLATVLFTDIVESTTLAAAMGDRAWTTRLEEHDRLVARQILRFGGELVKNLGDGTLATFDGPARAILCTTAVRDAVRQLGLELRAGLHTGEVELRGDDVFGIAVHLAQRVSARAEPGEVLVSRTVVDLVVGSGIRFHDRGEHELKGVPGPWKLFAVAE
jgi:class 3 adenylate cyclase/pimeloyl-ACP methyl ester carboxylesterase